MLLLEDTLPYQYLRELNSKQQRWTNWPRCLGLLHPSLDDAEPIGKGKPFVPVQDARDCFSSLISDCTMKQTVNGRFA